MARWRCGTGNAGDGDGSDSGGGAVRGNGVAHHSVRSGGVASARPHGSDRGVTFRGVALLRAPGCGQPRRREARAAPEVAPKVHTYIVWSWYGCMRRTDIVY